MALLEQVEDGEVDHKIIAVQEGEHLEIDDLTIAKLRDFISHVFDHIPGKSIALGNVLGRREAEAYVWAHADDGLV